MNERRQICKQRRASAVCSMTSAEDFKTLGNKNYKAHRYSDAIEAYSRAIIKNPEVATYYTNRALCYLQTKEWEKVTMDCRRAAELDRSSVKAFYFWGKATMQLEQYDESIKLLTKANELANSHREHFGDDIMSQLRMARREKFCLEEEKRIMLEIDLQIYLNRLIDEDLSRNLQKSQISADSMESNDENLTCDETERARLAQEAQTNKDKLNLIFAQVDEKRKRRDIPDYLCGKISLGLLRDPVITPSGITYDRSDILEHLKRVGHFDPVTRHALTEKQLIPNLAMREVVENFLLENPWAQYEDLA